jgi:glycosyltransferase involved in cell wall biosynthesis
MVRIAVYTGKFPDGPVNRFVVETFYRIVAGQPGHEFLFLSDRALPELTDKYPNNSYIYIQHPAPNPVSWKWWLHITLPRLLKKIRAEALIISGITAKTTIPQTLLVQDLNSLHYKSEITKPQLHFLRRHIPTSIQKAGIIVTFSSVLRKRVNELVWGAADKTVIINGVAGNPYQNRLNEENDITRKNVSGGKQFFLALNEHGTTAELINLLKAFSLFKKMQRSSMRLLIAGNPDQLPKDFYESLDTYKYKTDVTLHPVNDEEQEGKLISAAYAVVLPEADNDTGLSGLKTLQCGTALIAASDTAVAELAGENAFFFQPDDAADLAARMMEVYKEEDLRNKKAIAGQKATEHYTYDRAALLLWQAFESMKT